MFGLKSKRCFICCPDNLIKSVLRRQVFKVLVIFLLIFFVKTENSYAKENNKIDSKLIVYDNAKIKVDLEITPKSDIFRPLFWQLLAGNKRIIAAGKSIIKPMHNKVEIFLNIPKLEKDVILKTRLNYLLDKEKLSKIIIIVDKNIVKKKLFSKRSLRIINSDLYLKLKKYLGKNVDITQCFNSKKKSKFSDFTIMLVADYNKDNNRLSRDINTLLVNGKRVFLVADKPFKINLPENGVEKISISKQYEMTKKKINLRIDGNLLAENMVLINNNISLNINSVNKTKLEISGELKNKKSDLVKNQLVKLKYQKGELIIFNYNIFKQLIINPLSGLLLLELEK